MSTFVKQVAERAVKTALQAAIALFTAGHFDWFNADWKANASVILTAAAASVLTSIASLRFGPPDSPSLVPITPQG